MDALTASLWKRYHGRGDERARHELLSRYLGLVHHCVAETLRRVPASVEREELLSAGTVGLVQALESFEPERGFAFSSYAVPRIRGALLDELRAQDWMTRTGRERSRELEQARRAFVERSGREPSLDGLAAELGVDADTCRRWREQGERPVYLPLDGAASGPDLEDVTLAETIPDPDAPVPGAAIERDESLRELREGLEGLPPKDRLVVVLYYYESLSLRQIGGLLHVTESRVSQILGRGVRRLREHLATAREEA